MPVEVLGGAGVKAEARRGRAERGALTPVSTGLVRLNPAGPKHVAEIAALNRPR